MKLKEAIKNTKKSSLITYVVLRALVIFCLVREIIFGNYLNALLCVLSLVLFYIPSLIEKTFKIDLPDGLEIAIYCFIFAAEILGEIENFYGVIPMWDNILHTINGFLAASVGFSLVNLLNKKVKHFKLSPVFVALVAFCFSMTIGVMWEFFEYSVDKFTVSDMQKDEIVRTIKTGLIDEKSKTEVIKNIDKTILYDENGNEIAVINGGYLDIGLNDTMEDLFVNLIGAGVFSALGYLYIIGKDKYKIAQKFQIKKQE